MVNVSSGTSRSKHRLTRRGWVILIVSLLVIVAIALILIIRQSQQQASRATKTPTVKIATLLSADPTVASYHATDLDSEIKTATTDAQKVAVYSRYAAAASTGGNNDLAIEDMLKAEALFPSADTAYFLGNLYWAKYSANKSLPDKTETVKYFTLFLSRIDAAYKIMYPGRADNVTSVLKALQS